MAVLIAEDMMCDHCVDRIKNGLEDADIEAEVDLGDKTVKIEGDDEVVEKAKEILGDLGFLAEEI
ncbi:MAG TPA: heavy-metal-associated domain-containing protein [Candidatus Anaerostipes excrementavium]|uniref:Heavy-metal-associated domain-containing protein n=1 Tax=Candidatus Anaerostipes excrementavium TaxID=2838463 RepID=A0A9D1WYF6_9FIRM|nr:heavy metal-associated domain-containing protein [uncultured Anaerostipes sp.]HIX68300.1 heavy-metal-associated domain-containing protein [Candidatus Anaerostipes excrementavium]